MSMAVKYGMRKRMAKGGDTKVKSGSTQGDDSATPGGVQADVSRKEWGSGARRGTSVAGEHVRGAAMAKKAGQNRAESSRKESAKNLHREAIGKLKSDKKDRTNLYDGGEVTKPTVDAEKGKLVSDSFKKAMGFSEGGCVSCESGRCMTHGGLVDRIMAKRQPELADFAPNEFDDLELDPAPEDTSSAGNEIGDPIPDDEDDMVSRIMRRRSA